MNKYDLVNKFKTVMDKYIRCKYNLGFDFHQLITLNNMDTTLKYSIFSLDRDRVEKYNEVAEKNIDKYWAIFARALNKNNYKKAYRICKYIRKMAKGM